MNRITQHKCSFDGQTFDSREEMKYYIDISSDPSVSCIHRQTKLVVLGKSEVFVRKTMKTKTKVTVKFLEHPITYKPDFIYFQHGIIYVVDVKSEYTHTFREFSLIRKLVIRKIIEHNNRRHGGQARMVFREVQYKNGRITKTTDKPPVGSLSINISNEIH